jgi:hypothetical protein
MGSAMKLLTWNHVTIFTIHTCSLQTHPAAVGIQLIIPTVVAGWGMEYWTLEDRTFPHVCIWHVDIQIHTCKQPHSLSHVSPAQKIQNFTEDKFYSSVTVVWHNNMSVCLMHVRTTLPFYLNFTLRLHQTKSSQMNCICTTCCQILVGAVAHWQLHAGESLNKTTYYYAHS